MADGKYREDRPLQAENFIRCEAEVMKMIKLHSDSVKAPTVLDPWPEEVVTPTQNR